jgi:hypothetical protein
VWWGAACDGIVGAYAGHRARGNTARAVGIDNRAKTGNTDNTDNTGKAGTAGDRRDEGILGASYFTGINFGTLELDWADAGDGGGIHDDSNSGAPVSVVVSVRNMQGDVVLSASHGQREAARALRVLESGGPGSGF